MEEYTLQEATIGEILSGLLAFSKRDRFNERVLYELLNQKGLGDIYGKREVITAMNVMLAYGRQIFQKPGELHTDRYFFNPNFRRIQQEEISPEKRKVLEELAQEFDSMHAN